MFCNNCGSEIREDSNFCWKCGKPQKSGFQTDEPVWEICEISYEIAHGGGFFESMKHKYVAKAIGPKGSYIVGESTPTSSRGGEILDNLIEKLTNDNWEPTGKGEHYFNYKFRRRIK